MKIFTHKWEGHNDVLQDAGSSGEGRQLQGHVVAMGPGSRDTVSLRLRFLGSTSAVWALMSALGNPHRLQWP